MPRATTRKQAAVAIAAVHVGKAFRNTLLAWFDHPDYSAQLKIGHLHALPGPPRDGARLERVSALARRATPSKRS